MGRGGAGARAERAGAIRPPPSFLTLAEKLPSLRPQQIISALEKCGLTVIRQTGSHVVLAKQGLPRPVVIARHNKELSPRVVAHLLTQADVAAEEFLSKL